MGYKAPAGSAVGSGRVDIRFYNWNDGSHRSR